MSTLAANNLRLAYYELSREVERSLMTRRGQAALLREVRGSVMRFVQSAEIVGNPCTLGENSDTLMRL